MRYWLVLALILVALGLGGPVWACETLGRGLGQNWTSAQRDSWYQAAPGRGLMPDRWYRALKRADDGTSFAARKSLQRYGFVYCDQPESEGENQAPASPDPVGFVVKADAPNGPVIGLGCAACHTGRLSDGKRDFVVHGGAGALDLQNFTTDLFTALLLARSGSFADAQQAKPWKAFSTAVLGKAHSEAKASALHQAVTEWLQANKSGQASRHFGGVWGFGRIDRQANLASRLLAFANPFDEARPMAATAPVSVPSLWLTAQMPRLGWLGADASGPAMSALRLHSLTEAYIAGTGQVGLIGGVTANETKVVMQDLAAAEAALARLPRPVWPPEWGQIDRNSADFKAGQGLYQQHCVACHAMAPANALGSFADLTGASSGADQKAPFVKIVGWSLLGTDPARMCHDVSDLIRPGLAQTIVGPMPPVATATTVAQALVASLAGQPLVAAPLSTHQAPRVPRPSSRGAKSTDELQSRCAPWLSNAIIGYKAAPLAGIFASAPYLHNGSVPSLDALLSPPDQRPARFSVGDVLFDPVKVGVGAAVENGVTQMFLVTDNQGKDIPGNSNAGHQFPAHPLSAVEKAQLILFLKSL